MKKSITLLLFIFLGLSCSTNNDSNGNSTTTVVPIAPTNLAGTVVSTSQINLSWIDNSTNETGFKIERKTGTGNYVLVGTVNSNVLIFSDTGLTPGTAYIYRVYSYNATGSSSYSNEVSLTTNMLIVTIGSQKWTQTNLDVTHYRNGDIIPQVTDLAQWESLTTGAWCYYNNDPLNNTIYGKLYNWYAVNDPRGLAPIGYHIPSDSEWATLITYLGGEQVAGGKLKTTGTSLWQSPNTGATNTTNFTALPGGYRIVNGTFNYIGKTGCWWSSTEVNATNAWTYDLFNNSSICYRDNLNKPSGFSVRCIKD